MRILLIDNNDSFTYNIVELLRSLDDVLYGVLPSKVSTLLYWKITATSSYLPAQ